jgi:rare lipoprotein A
MDGEQTASGEIYRNDALTGAHRTLEFGTKVRVTNLDNGETVEVVINDRGPVVEGIIIDVSYSAAQVLDMLDAGIVDARIEVVD